MHRLGDAVHGWVDVGHRLPTQRTVTGRLAAELGMVVTGVVVVGFSTGALVGPLVADGYHAHYVLALLAAGCGTAAVGLGHTAGRIAGNRRAAWLIPALALYCVVVVPTTTVPPGRTEEIITPHPALLVGCLAVATLLLVAIRPPARSGLGAGWATAAVGALLTLATAGFAGMPGLVPMPTSPAALNVAVLLGWWTVSAAVVIAGHRAGSAPLWRVGLGFGVIASAHLYRVGRVGPVAEAGLVFSTLRLLGVVVVMLGMAQLLRRALNDVLGERFAHQEEVRLAGIRAEHAARAAAEREHELRNGLTGLSGIAMLLDQGGQDDQDDEDGRSRARSAAIAELRRLTDLLDVRPSQPFAGLYCASEVVEELVALWRVADADLQAWIPPGLMAVGRSSVLAQALTNVLTNCARHAPGSPVGITAQQVGGMVIVQVRDEGRAHRTGADTGGVAGQGIGLRISRRLLRAEGGELRVHPVDPMRPGWTVSIELVAGPAEPPLAVTDPPARPPAQVPSG